MQASGDCGSKPRRLAVGIAPLGIVSIGIVPMGVLNATVVGMGVLIAGVNVMGVWWVGLEGMEPFRLGAGAALVQHHHGAGPGQPGAGAAGSNLYAYPSRAVALQKARELGCTGVHAMGKVWMPCSQHPTP